ncbi:MAG: RnfABCDGE type electron transport complex subunit G [Candidatus Cloacimonetes bacterium]|nr:RnfABCDGE type electron transport complex subunit G [Candidatus Cloacimonadota bacterium]
MKLYLKLGFILLVVTVIATGILAYVNSITAPQIEALKQEEAIKSREELIPDSIFEEVEVSPDFSYFIARNKDTEEIQGYTFIASQRGYSDNVKTMAGVDPDFKLTGIKVVEQSETPGLGANCTGPDFTKQFQGKTMEDLMADKDGGKIKSLSGATITTRAIASSLKQAIQTLQQHVQQQAQTIQEDAQ